MISPSAQWEVYVCRGDVRRYPRAAPFHPSLCHPEALFGGFAGESNPVYDMVRRCFHGLGLDAENFGTKSWNPLKDLIQPASTVLLKPNLVKEFHPRDPDGWQYIITHGSVIRAVADYVWKALEGKGRIIVVDAPQTDSSFSALSERVGLAEIQNFYGSHGLDFSVIDLRNEEWKARGGVICERRPLPGDPAGYIAYDLGSKSEFNDHTGSGRYYGADYFVDELNRHHSGGRHEYLIAATAINADVIISLPKLKTHKKAGMTGALKNLVGINGDKNWLPHHTEGSPSSGGDECPNYDWRHALERWGAHQMRALTRRFPSAGAWVHRRVRRAGARVFGDTENVVRSGNWWGNDTTWRMCLDLNKILFYGNPDGTLRAPGAANRKPHYVLVDGIVAGEGRGPMNPDPVQAGILIFGTHPASVDAACVCLMGFDPEKVPIVRKAFQCKEYSLAEWGWRDVHLLSDKREWNGALPAIPIESVFHFEPHFGWKGHIERQPVEARISL